MEWRLGRLASTSQVGVLCNAVHLQEFVTVMPSTKTATLTFRIDPGLKDALRAAAQQEHRSIANMVEVLIRDHCEQRGIAIASPEDTKNNSGKHSA